MNYLKKIPIYIVCKHKHVHMGGLFIYIFRNEPLTTIIAFALKEQFSGGLHILEMATK